MKRRSEKNSIRQSLKPQRVLRMIRNLAGILILIVLFAFAPQKGPSSPKQVERMRARQEKAARAKYEKDLKQHQKNQSKNTRSMMKKSKKESRKNTPLKPASGKKCPG